MATLIDILLGLAFILTALAGLRNGYFRELFSLIGLALGVYAALRFTGPVADLTGLSFLRSEFGATILFVVVFIIVFIVASLLGSLLAGVWEGKSPGFASRAVGFLLGAFRGYLLVVVMGGAVVFLADVGSQSLATSRVLPWLGTGIRIGAHVLPDDLGANLEERWDAIPFQPAWKKQGVPI
ncbi:MAG: CvpA family protein [Candidatus Eisenbacteria bacterium]|uniref:CvpA family protein n=1 Tax=Eiseniibacteriota bacterium TaxID=2212470 RepID=A0A956SGC6_UNCEI|nr:CvpA family protein [Candidatus Eisenbacteria bacterium]MCB9462745.1 CvpA family protein [Candidatus Eisenbacteria bacterium]